MYLAIVKVITRYWGLEDREPGVHALQCCAAAGAEQEALGEMWNEAEAMCCYGQIMGVDARRVAGELAHTLRAHRLPCAAAAVRHLAQQAARLKAEAADFAKGDLA